MNELCKAKCDLGREAELGQHTLGGRGSMEAQDT